jgi:hypothetical protein
MEREESSLPPFWLGGTPDSMTCFSRVLAAGFCTNVLILLHQEKEKGAEY